MSINKFDPNSLVFSLDEVQSIEKTLNTKFASWLKDRSFQLTTSGDNETACVTLTLKNDSETFCYPVESRILHREQNVSKNEAAVFLVDYIDSYFDEYFREDESVYLPIDWSSYAYEGIEFQIKGQVLNRYMDDLADQLLAGNSLAEDALQPHKIRPNIQ